MERLRTFHGAHPYNKNADRGEGEMKVYEGGRSLAGAVVTVDGRKLDPRFDLKKLSKAGFEWTYEGAGPAQLALALLADHFGDDQKALKLHDAFMREVVANLDNSWRMTSAEIDEALARLVDAH
jgi:hypothetical protein